MRKFLFIILINFCLFNFVSCEGKQKKNNDPILLGLILSSGQTSSMNAASASCPPAGLPEDIPIANTIVSANSTVSGFNDSSKAINGICGGGETSGSLDTYSLNLTGDGATLKLSWGGKTVKNVSGIDFIIYENSFRVSGTSDRYFIEPMVVEVSLDDVNYCGFPLTHDSTTATLNRISSWVGFAGLRPVLYNMTSQKFSLNELFTSIGDGFLQGGGDGFDLDNLQSSGACTTGIRDNIKTNGFKFIKMTSASSVINPGTGNFYTYPHSFDNASDIDGVVARTVQ